MRMTRGRSNEARKLFALCRRKGGERCNRPLDVASLTEYNIPALILTALPAFLSFSLA